MSMKAPESFLFDGKLASRPGYADSVGQEGQQTAKSEGLEGGGSQPGKRDSGGKSAPLGTRTALGR